jgi:hypothetical protein
MQAFPQNRYLFRHEAVKCHYFRFGLVPSRPTPPARISRPPATMTQLSTSSSHHCLRPFYHFVPYENHRSAVQLIALPPPHSGNLSQFFQYTHGHTATMSANGSAVPQDKSVAQSAQPEIEEDEEEEESGVDEVSYTMKKLADILANECGRLPKVSYTTTRVLGQSIPIATESVAVAGNCSPKRKSSLASH